MTDQIKPPPALIRARLAALPAIAWCDEHRLKLHEIEAVTVAAYIEQLGNQASKPTVKQHLAAIRQLCDYLTNGGILEVNPAASVRGTKIRGEKRQDAGAVGRGSAPAARFN